VCKYVHLNITKLCISIIKVGNILAKSCERTQIRTTVQFWHTHECCPKPCHIHVKTSHIQKRHGTHVHESRHPLQIFTSRGTQRHILIMSSPPLLLRQCLRSSLLSINTLSVALAPSLSLPPAPSLSLPLAFSLSHSRFLTFSLSCSLALSLSRSLSRTLTRPHPQTHALSHTHTQQVGRSNRLKTHIIGRLALLVVGLE